MSAPVTGGTQTPHAPHRPPQRSRRRGGPWTWLAGVEVALCIAVVVADWLVPTLVILVLVALSLACRREGLRTLGFQRPDRPRTLAARVLALTVAWTVLQLAVFMPVLNHATGERQDLSDFASLEGSVGQLMLLLVLSWTLAAFGEELVYRGFVPTRVTDVLGSRVLGVAAGVAVSSILFALAHTEQGQIGVAVTFLDALFFSALRLRYGTLFAPVLAHGFNNTIGLVAYFLIGPVYGLW